MDPLVLRGSASGEHSLTFRERVLYHHIHPAKLFADIATALVAADLFWRHALAPGLIIALLPPVLVSAVLLREADLGHYRSRKRSERPAGPHLGSGRWPLHWS